MARNGETFAGEKLWKRREVEKSKTDFPTSLGNPAGGENPFHHGGTENSQSQKLTTKGTNDRRTVGLHPFPVLIRTHCG